MYKGKKRSWIKHLDFTILDLLMTQLALVLAFGFRFGSFWPYSQTWWQRLAAVMVLIQICVIFFTDPYQEILRRDKMQELKCVIMNCTLTYFLLIVFLYGMKMSEIYSRLTLFMMWGITVPVTYIARLLWKRRVRAHVRDERNRSRMILLVSDAAVENCIREFEKDPYRNYIISGIVIMDKNREGEFIREVPVVANADNFLDYVRTNAVDEVFINGNDILASQLLAEELLEMGLTVHFKLVHQSKLMPNKTLKKLANYMVLTSSMNIASPGQLFLKRALDILGGIVGLILTAIFYIIFAPIIKIQSPGPVFFSQIRVGRNGRRFRLYKFRSMYPDAEQRKSELMAENKMDGLMFKMDNDPRIFPIGRFMRKYSIDEFPQFWNVLKGDMSLVGTRPPTEDEFVQYEAHHRARLSFKPGLTGMWQVSGRNKITDFERVVELDTQYISEWSIAMDLRILFKTVLVVLKGSGAE